MLFFDFMYNYDGDDFKHLPGLVRRFLIHRLINTMQKESKRWDIERFLDADAMQNIPSHKEDLQDVLNNLALAQEASLLPSNQFQVLQDIYFNGRTQEQVASATNRSSRQISRYHKTAIHTLHTKLTT